MDKNVMKRDNQGKFVLKNEDHRSVRSLRLTDSAWETLGMAAKSLDITRADLLEQIVRGDDQNHPCNTRRAALSLPCLTWNDEVKERPDEVLHGLPEKTTSVEQAVIRLEDLEVLCAQVLKDLKLGKQAPGYKTANKALKHLLTLAHHPKVPM